MPDITDLTELNETPAAGDEFLVYDVSAGTGNSKKVTRANLLGGVAFEGGDHDFGTSEITDLTTQNASIGFTGGAVLTKMVVASFSVAPSDILTAASETVTATVTGALTSHFLVANFTSALPNGLVCQSWISAADTVSFKFYNTTGGTISGASYTVQAMLIEAS